MDNQLTQQIPAKPKRKLTRKQRDFVKEYIANGENGTQAALKVYDVKDNIVAKAVASENLSKPYIQETVNEERKRMADRIPDALLEKVHLEGLEATVTRFTPEGEKIEVPDFSTRHKFMDSGYKLKGEYAPEKSISVNVGINPRDPKAVELAREYEEKLKSGIANP